MAEKMTFGTFGAGVPYGVIVEDAGLDDELLTSRLGVGREMVVRHCMAATEAIAHDPQKKLNRANVRRAALSRLDRAGIRYGFVGWISILWMIIPKLIELWLNYSAANEVNE